MRTLIATAALIGAFSLLVAGCGGGDDAAGNPESKLSPEEATAPLDDAPPQLAAIREQANELLPGGVDAFAERMKELRGVPVVINKWASWCGPCRLEFPHFQAQADKRADEIAFLGTLSNDGDEPGRDFLEQLPLPYPSYSDPDHNIADEFMDNAREFPATAFYDSSGELTFVKLGPYATEDELAADIDRYAQ
jgi:cytochrome c biogenesis protein CcmG, thiol:disulfide interchange protein DsbE